MQPDLLLERRYNMKSIHELAEEAKTGNFISVYEAENLRLIQDRCLIQLSNAPTNVDELVDLVTIGNCTYNNTTSENLPI